MPLRLILTYVVVRNTPVPKNIAEKSESDHKDTQKLQVDEHAVVDCMVKEVEWEKESQWQKRKQVVAKKAEEETAAKSEAEWITRRAESQRMDDKVSCIVAL